MNIAFVGNNEHFDNEIRCHCVPELLAWYLEILERASCQAGFCDEAVGQTMCRQCAVGATFTSARNCTPNEVLLSGTNVSQGAFERMTKDTTATAPSTMKIKVVAPPVGTSSLSKRFHCAKVLQTEVFAVPYGWLIGRPVSKSHQLQSKEQLRFVSASRFLFVL